MTRAERFETFDSAQEIDRTEGHQGIIPEITGENLFELCGLAWSFNFCAWMYSCRTMSELRILRTNCNTNCTVIRVILIWYFLISKYFLIFLTIARDMSNLCLGFLFSIEWCFSGLHRNPQDSWYAWYDSLRILEFLILQGCFIIVFHQSCLCPMDSV